MADKKISQLTALSAANLAPSTDVLAIVDTSATETKKIVAQDLVNGVLNVASAVGIGTSSPGFKLDINGVAAVRAANAIRYYRADNAIYTQLYDAGSSGFTLDNTNGNGFRFQSAGTNQAVLDSSGNLGLGVTPSLWRSTEKAIQIGSWMGLYTDSGLTSEVSYNTYINSSNQYIYQNTGYASRYQQYLGDHAWFTAASGTAAGTISFGNAKMVLTNAGNLGVGTTSPGSPLTINKNGAQLGATTAYLVSLHRDSTPNKGISLGYDSGSQTGIVLAASNADASNLAFWNYNGSAWGERARITSGGYFKASNTGGYDSATGAYHELLNNDASDAVVLVTHFGATNPLGIGVAFTAASPDDNTQYFLRCADSTTARCFIYSDGDLANHDGVYGTISDERLKQDIVDAPSQWNDLKAVRFRKYRMKTDVEANPDAPALLGVVAQELEQTSPGLIDEHPNEDGTTTKTVKSSILLMKAAVALQEAMTRIEQLEAKVAALESK